MLKSVHCDKSEFYVKERANTKSAHYMMVQSSIDLDFDFFFALPNLEDVGSERLRAADNDIEANVALIFAANCWGRGWVAFVVPLEPMFQTKRQMTDFALNRNYGLCRA